MPIRLIATDLDRTLLRSDKTVSDYTVDVLARCRAAGILVAFATSRSAASCTRFTQVIHPDALIVNGGANAFLGERLVYERTVDADTASALTHRMMDTPGVGYITADTASGYYVNHPIDIGHPSWRDYSHAIPRDFRAPFDVPVYKITAQIPDVRTAQSLSAAFPDMGMFGFGGTAWVRFAHREADKYAALCALARAAHIPPADIAAFGDDDNDADMLRYCGYGVAMADATPNALSAAHTVCGLNDEDAVARWLEEHVFAG